MRSETEWGCLKLSQKQFFKFSKFQLSSSNDFEKKFAFDVVKAAAQLNAIVKAWLFLSVHL